MRLGGPILSAYSDPADWIAQVKLLNYRAVYWPLEERASDDVALAFAKTARVADVVIAEVGAWNNPISPDETTRRLALQHCKERLAVADLVGARCCVNIAGARGDQWDGAYSENFSPDTFALIVDTIREIIDAVRPSQTFYALETMPWSFPDSTDSYQELIRAVDRARFAVHFDPVNLIYNPRRYFSNGAIIAEFVERLGQWIKSCHAKDVILDQGAITHLRETRPGLGALDYDCFVRAVEGLDPDMPLMLEHLDSEQEYSLAADYIRQVAHELSAAEPGRHEQSASS
jgi:sugar phosphate isomerase/epimerase